MKIIFVFLKRKFVDTPHTGAEGPGTEADIPEHALSPSHIRYNLHHPDQHHIHL